MQRIDCGELANLMMNAVEASDIGERLTPQVRGKMILAANQLRTPPNVREIVELVQYGDAFKQAARRLAPAACANGRN